MPEATTAAARVTPLPAQIEELQLLLGGYRVSQAINVMARLGIADLLADGARDHDELARAPGTHAHSLCRVLRFLAGIGAFRGGRAASLCPDPARRWPVARRAWLAASMGPPAGRRPLGGLGRVASHRADGRGRVQSRPWHGTVRVPPSTPRIRLHLSGGHGRGGGGGTNRPQRRLRLLHLRTNCGRRGWPGRRPGRGAPKVCHRARRAVRPA
jgi:hypothetical protein